MTVFGDTDFSDHEQVVFCSDEATGLRAIIAIHDTRRGPALGGCRMWNYSSEAEAVHDVLRLSLGMTYKAAMAGIDLGGGKSVIMGDPHTEKTPALMQAMGRAVERLSGRYIIAEDVGTSVADMTEIRKSTRFVTGLGSEQGGTGDPSPTTAWGCFLGLKAAVAHGLGLADLKGCRVALQGLGNVGWNLCRYLREHGAQVTVCDVRPERVEQAASELGARAVAVEDIYDVDADVFAPCALGGILNDDTIPRLKASVVAGAANNQLARPHHADALTARGITYAPDYIVNAAGLIQVNSEWRGLDRAWVDAKVKEIPETLRQVFAHAAQAGVSTAAAAEALARRRLGRAA